MGEVRQPKNCLATKRLVNGKLDVSRLTQEDKEKLSAVGALVGAASGYAVGGDTANAQVGGVVAKNAVENNSVAIPVNNGGALSGGTVTNQGQNTNITIINGIPHEVNSSGNTLSADFSKLVNKITGIFTPTPKADDEFTGEDCYSIMGVTQCTYAPIASDQ